MSGNGCNRHAFGYWNVFQGAHIHQASESPQLLLRDNCVELSRDWTYRLGYILGNLGRCIVPCGSHQKSGTPIHTPSSWVLMLRTPANRTPSLYRQSHSSCSYSSVYNTSSITPCILDYHNSQGSGTFWYMKSCRISIINSIGT